MKQLHLQILNQLSDINTNLNIVCYPNHINMQIFEEIIISTGAYFLMISVINGNYAPSSFLALRDMYDEK